MSKQRSSGIPSAQFGLTLIELLIAITVLAVLAVLGWRGLDSIVRTRVALTADLEQTRGMQLTFAQLQTDCAHVAEASVLPEHMPVIIEQNKLKLVRTVFPENQPSQLQVVTYRVSDGILTRRESADTRDLSELAVLWQDPVSDSTADVVLLADVASLDMRLWITNGWRSSLESLAPNVATPTGHAPKMLPANLPTGLEVSLKLNGHDASLLKIFLLGAV